jgi:hypothetical protein
MSIAVYIRERPRNRTPLPNIVKYDIVHISDVFGALRSGALHIEGRMNAHAYMCGV